MQKLPAVLSVKDKNNPPSIKVARVHFAYDNFKIWEDLAKRGALLKNGDFKKASDIESTMK
jgi:hypothetical protein